MIKGDLRKALRFNALIEFVSIPWSNYWPESGAESPTLTVNLATWFIHVFAGNAHSIEWEYKNLQHERLSACVWPCSESLTERNPNHQTQQTMEEINKPGRRAPQHHVTPLNVRSTESKSTANVKRKRELEKAQTKSERLASRNEMIDSRGRARIRLGLLSDSVEQTPPAMMYQAQGSFEESQTSGSPSTDDEQLATEVTKRRRTRAEERIYASFMSNRSGASLDDRATISSAQE